MSAPAPFFWIDVFTDRPLSGNQLAVFTLAAPRIADAHMQAIARVEVGGSAVVVGRGELSV